MIRVTNTLQEVSVDITSSENPPFRSADEKHLTATVLPFHLAFLMSPNVPLS